MLHESNKKQVHEALASKPSLLLEVFYASWCGPCRMYKGSLEELAEKHGVEIYRINIDESRDYAAEALVSSIPFTRVYRDGQLVSTFLGYKPYGELKAILGL
ncbi:thioredoxin family protein [Mycoplasma seminis]|uniref:Thioredoxin n=1 Tax=Mycoplasma seminis TaxID=512749 RepID=A0ABY9HA98_9MOLU|nr:thioredoxin family protein [Mycoplasma seminis]WLP85510.1 thioredoxin family protein [Mycoplasma seminis]